MKTILVVLMLFMAVSARDYSESYVMYREIMASGLELVNIMESAKLEVVKVDVDLVSLTNKKVTLKVMNPNFTYFISAVGQPSRIANLNVKVYFLDLNGKKTFIAQDIEPDNFPIIKLTPSASGTYMIEVYTIAMVKGCENSTGYYFLVMGHT